MKNWYILDVGKVAEELKVDLTKGLTQNDATDRLTGYGKNELPRGKEIHWWQILLSQFKNPLIIILIIAASLTYWLGEHLDTIVILMAVTVNIAISFWQEFRSNNIFEKLQKLITITSRVKRDGVLHEIVSEDLVPGDIISLSTGVKIPADARLLSSEELEINESLLTGESEAVKKNSEFQTTQETPLADRRNMVYTGTVVEKGNAEAVIVSTGKNTELGQIALLTTSVKDEKTPLQERLTNLSKKISILVIILTIIIFSIGIFGNGNIVEMFTLAIAVAVASIPEGLPAAMAIVLAVSSQKILKKKGLVKTLVGAETLGSTTVICTDKTGTLTEGVMKVEKLYLTQDENRASMIMALANEAQMIESNKISGETTDKAKMEFFLKHGGNLEDTFLKHPRISLLPFDSEDKYIASVHKSREGDVQIYVTGAPEHLLSISTKNQKEKNEIISTIEDLASQGFRIIGIAEKIIKTNNDFDYKNRNDIKKHILNLEFLGLAAIRDPIRNEVKESMKIMREAGIKAIMITGDHRLTAKSIGKELGFKTDPKNIVTGADLDKMSKQELYKRVKDIEIISRANPSHKMMVIDALKKNKEVVAMTGDGVNDAPALKVADIGISLGAGTDVTKEAADLVLVNDSFSTIVSAVQEGRVAFDNIRKVTIFNITDSFTEVILVLTSLFMGLPFLAITAVQILWANLIEDGLPTLSLAFDPGEKNIMQRKPFKRIEPIINKMGYYIIGLVGILSDFILVGLFWWLVNHTSFEIAHIQTIMFAALGMDTLIFIFSIKTLHRSAFSKESFNNKYLLIAVGIGFMLMFGALYIPILNKLLGTIPLGIIGLSLALGTGIFRFLFIEVVKLFTRRSELIKHIRST